MKQTLHVDQGMSVCVNGQWYNQGDHEIDAPDVEVAQEAAPVAKSRKPKQEDPPTPAVPPTDPADGGKE